MSVIKIVLLLHDDKKKQGGVDKALLEAIGFALPLCDWGLWTVSLDPRLDHGNKRVKKLPSVVICGFAMKGWVYARVKGWRCHASRVP